MHKLAQDRGDMRRTIKNDMTGSALAPLVLRMLEVDPDERPTVTQCLKCLSQICKTATPAIDAAGPCRCSLATALDLCAFK